MNFKQAVKRLRDLDRTLDLIANLRTETIDALPEFSPVNVGDTIEVNGELETGKMMVVTNVFAGLVWNDDEEAIPSYRWNVWGRVVDSGKEVESFFPIDV